MLPHIEQGKIQQVQSNERIVKRVPNGDPHWGQVLKLTPGGQQEIVGCWLQSFLQEVRSEGYREREVELFNKTVVKDWQRGISDTNEVWEPVEIEIPSNERIVRRVPNGDPYEKQVLKQQPNGQEELVTCYFQNALEVVIRQESKELEVELVDKTIYDWISGKTTKVQEWAPVK